MKKFVLLLSLLLCIKIYAQSIDIELLKKADDYFEKHDYYNAKKIYENIVNSPDIKQKDRVMFNLGKSYYSLQQKEKAYNTFSTLISEYPDSKYSQKSIPMIITYLTEKREYNKAISLLEKYSLKYNDITLKKELLKVYEKARYYDKALTFLENNFQLSEWYIEKKVKYMKHLKKYDDAIKFLNSIIQQYHRPQYYRMLAEIYIEKKNFDKAEHYYNEAYQISNDVQYIISIGRMYAINNNVKKAINSWQRLFKIFGNRKFTYRQLINLYKEYGFYSELLKLYKEAEKEGFDFTKEKINTLEIMGKYKEAVNEYIKIIDSDNFDFIKEKLVRLAIIEGEFDIVTNILKKKIDNSDLYLKKRLMEILYQIYYESNKIELAIKLLKSYVQLDSPDIFFVDEFTDALLNKKEYQSLYDIYNNFKDINSLPYSLRFKYTKILYFLKKYNKALSEIKTINKKDDEIDYWTALIYFKLKKYDSALKSLKNYKKNFQQFSLLIDILAHSGKVDKALEYISKEKENKNFRKDVIYFKEGFLLLIKGDTPEARDDFNKVLTIYPNSEYANESALYLYLWNNEFIKNNNDKKEYFYNYMKNFYFGKYYKAANYILRCNINGTSLEYITKYLAAEAYYMNQDYDKALKLVIPLTKKESFVKQYALKLVGDIYYFKKKNKKEALKYYKEIIDKYPNNLDIQQIRNIILSETE